jgi:predicted RNA-binding Zn ribbon-like protein
VLPVKPLFLAGHPGLDFVNTTFVQLPERTPVELIGDGRSFVAWLVDAGLLEAAGASKLKRRFGEEALDAAAAEARKFRQWARDWIARWHEAPSANYALELHRLNQLLDRAGSYREVVVEDARLKIVERSRIDSASALLALVASQIALLVTTQEPELVKHCAGTDCVLWFVDRTKAHRRLFCSAAVCGNRAKVAAFRARQRAR